jgi:hypothetical protein
MGGAANGAGIGGRENAAGSTTAGVATVRTAGADTGGGTIDSGSGADAGALRTAWYCARKFSSATGAAI